MIMEFTLLTYLGSSILALAVGFLTGIFGIGGGFLMTPVLIAFLGIPAHIAVGTDLAAILVNSSYGIFKRRGTGTVDVRLALSIAAGSTVGIFLGIDIVQSLKTMPPLNIFGKEHPALQYVLLCLFLPLLFSIALLLVVDLRKNKNKNSDKRTGVFSRINIPPYAHFNSLDVPRMSILPIIVLGLLTGMLISLMGIGGGVIMLPALVYLVGQHTVKAAGTSLLLVWISSAISVAGHAAVGNVSTSLLISMLAGGIIGTNLGTHLGLRLSGQKIRFYFVYIVILAFAMVACKLLKMTFC